MNVCIYLSMLMYVFFLCVCVRAYSWCRETVSVNHSNQELLDHESVIYRQSIYSKHKSSKTFSISNDLTKPHHHQFGLAALQAPINKLSQAVIDSIDDAALAINFSNHNIHEDIIEFPFQSELRSWNVSYKIKKNCCWKGAEKNEWYHEY